MTKLKAAIFIAIAALGGVALLLQRQEQSHLSEQNRSLRRQVEQVAELQAESDRLSYLVSQLTNSHGASLQSQELSRLRSELAALHGQTNDLGRLRAENQQLRAARAATGARFGSAHASGLPGLASKQTWAFAGYADPESTFQSAMWAMSQGDAKTFLASLSPEGDAFKHAQDQPEHIAASLQQEVEPVTGISIIDKRVLADDEVILTVHAAGREETGKFRFQRTGSEWKLVGPVKDEAPPATK
ncbi:MAG: hypothetical protein C5B50_23145 [Verrucomicrobia bacterium]|nr:MAG: hypothetical protein C5B50_23145 [Verrucomicrobiota bacterium]